MPLPHDEECSHPAQLALQLSQYQKGSMHTRRAEECNDAHALFSKHAAIQGGVTYMQPTRRR